MIARTKFCVKNKTQKGFLLVEIYNKSPFFANKI